MQKLKKEYLKLTNGEFNKVIPLDNLKTLNIETVIKDYLFENNTNKFNIELLMFPNWASKSKKYKINEDYYTHIRIKNDF